MGGGPTHDDLIERLQATPPTSALNLQIYSRGSLHTFAIPATERAQSVDGPWATTRALHEQTAPQNSRVALGCHLASPESAHRARAQHKQERESRKLEEPLWLLG